MTPPFWRRYLSFEIVDLLLRVRRQDSVIRASVVTPTEEDTLHEEPPQKSGNEIRQKVVKKHEVYWKRIGTKRPSSGAMTREAAQ
mmetsp:Transcript_8633/g.22711  ORF Transcript_8633/g.22711 Transcript_8633/m.22711 type:complete len:85 (+) Transcript_8633:1003-1257(+)